MANTKNYDQTMRACLEVKRYFDKHMDEILESVAEAKKTGSEIVFEEIFACFMLSLQQVNIEYVNTFNAMLAVSDKEKARKLFLEFANTDSLEMIEALSQQLISDGKKAG